MLFLYYFQAPLLPLIRITLRNRLPAQQINTITMAGIGVALAHAGFIMSRDSSV